jgi:transcription elongation factor GreA
MTPWGQAALKEELATLKAERPKISTEIGTAAAHGDLKENAEYHAAREKQGMVEARIRYIEDQLSRAEVIDPGALSGSAVKFGATVHLEDADSGKELVYRIVGSDEAQAAAPAEGKISITSPVARALISREVGDEVKVKTPGGVKTYEVVDVRFS